IWQDPERTKASIRQFSEADAEALPAFQRDCGAFCDVLEPMLYAETTPSLGDVEAAFRAAGRRDLFRSFVLGSIADLLEDRFESDAVRGFLGLTSTFGTNAGPRTPGTAYVMAHHLFGATAGRGRAGYVRGGMGGLADALARAAASAGATLLADAEVARIAVDGDTATGVELLDGRRFRARHVVSNADPRRTFLGLVGERHLSDGFARDIGRIQMRGQALKLNAALSRLPRVTAAPEGVTPARVSICPSLDYVEDAWDAAKRGRFSPAPFMTVHMQSAIDPSLAPEGRHTLSCYAQYFPYDLAPELGGWEAQRTAAGEAVLAAVARIAPDVRDCILAYDVMTPADIEDVFAMTGGHQFHGDITPGQLFDDRPAPGCAGASTPIRGLYLCGAGTHPGGCVWGAPGERAAAAVLKADGRND
ncbi:MAG: NAD(P)/FAD-dependent oxidoreductase, partial [Alphaproteobacteria bacterium]